MEVYPDDPAVYHYTYSVDDDYTGAKIFADEERDGGDTHGMYEVSQHYNTLGTDSGGLGQYRPRPVSHLI